MRFSLICLILVLGIMVSVAQETSDLGSCPEDFEAYLPTRLIIGEVARVIFDVELNVRPLPTLEEARLGSLTGGTHINVIDGPVCMDEYVWWQIENENLTGWVAEGSLEDDEYFIEPRGRRVVIETGNSEAIYIETASGFLEPEGCLRPPDDYEKVQLGFATLNRRTLFMLDNAQRIYDFDGGTWAKFRYLITQGSYNPGGVSASFGTHDGGGAVDISVIDHFDGWVIMREEIPAMLRALRMAGFAAWLRDTDELYDGSIIHIHAIAIGDAESSEIAQQQVASDFGYFSGHNGLPPAEDEEPIPDIYGDPVVCEWMVGMGFDVTRD